MKNIKLLATVLFAGFVLQQPVMSQTGAQPFTPPASASGPESDVLVSNVLQLSVAPANTAAPAAATTTDAVAVASGNEPVTIAASNTAAGAEPVAVVPAEIAAADSAPTNAPAMESGGSQPAASDTAGNGQADAGSTGSTNVQASAKAGTNAPAAEAEIELPITFQDVPITTAIETLARLANVNYLMDPKIRYGQPDANGKATPEPMLSIHWEKVTARQALAAVLDNYGLQMIQNPQTHIAKITIKEPNAKPPIITRVIQLKYASVSNMLGAVQSVLNDPDHRSKVVGDTRTSQLVVIATEQEQAQVDALVARLDTPTRQVLIETKLVELSSNPSTKKGVDWSSTLQAQNIAFGNGVLSGTSTTTTQPTTTTTTSPSGATTGTTTTTAAGTASTLTSLIGNGGLGLSTASGLLPDTGFLTADGLKVVLSFLNQSKEAQVMSTPRVVTLDNETATISVTTTFPIVNITAGTANTTGGSSITYSNVGTVLEVTPRITANNYIWLKVIPDVSSFAGTQTIISGGQQFQADTFESRHIQTQVLIPNSHTLVMGGLVQDNPVAQYTKVPILGDIPILGLAFRSENKSLQKDNLLIFITPTIVQDSDFKAMATDFLKSSPQTMKDPMNANSWWDGAERQGDWSNPLKSADNQTPTTVMP
jgi:type II secretory pathway component GspD/PulD (secretin)